MKKYQYSKMKSEVKKACVSVFSECAVLLLKSIRIQQICIRCDPSVFQSFHSTDNPPYLEACH